MAILVNGEQVQLAEPVDETAFEITGAAPEYRLTETDQADPAGRFRLRVEGDQLLIQRAATAEWATATTILTLDGAGASVIYGDDQLLTLGADGDQVLVHSSAAILANTVLASVLLGTPVTPAIAADSLIISNVTASGDILVAGNRGGNSEAYLHLDPSTGNLSLFSRGSGSLDLYDDATQIVDATSGAWAFQQATVLSTVAGDMTLSAAAGADVLIGDDVTILSVDGGTGTVGIGGAAVTDLALRILQTGPSLQTQIRMDNLQAAAAGVGHAVIWRGDSGGVTMAQLRVEFTGADNNDTEMKLLVRASDIEVERIAMDEIGISFFGVSPQSQQVTIANADGTLADVTAKFNTLLADLEGYGLLGT